MLNRDLKFALLTAPLLASVIVALGQNPTPLLTQPADKLIAVLKSDAAQKEKVDACRELAVVGTQEAVPALAALLGDEKLSHMARHALETIHGPAVDQALRDALGKLKGRPLVGVIGSIGVRRDTRAVELLSKLLSSPDGEVSQAAARALGSIGNAEAAKALLETLADIPRGYQLADCEGLLRCAETLTSGGRNDEALKIYQRLRSMPASHQVRAAALRGAILAGQKDGISLLREHLRGGDYVLFAAANRTALEMPGVEVTKALTSELTKLPGDYQLVVIQTLGKRGDPAACATLHTMARSGAKAVRLGALRALAEIGDPSSSPRLMELLEDPDPEISAAAKEGLTRISLKK